MENYSRVRTVGRGAYGIVQLVRRKKDNKLVIIKEIPVEEMTLEERQSALNEVKVLDMLNHPNIISYCDSFFEDKALMIVCKSALFIVHVIVSMKRNFIIHPKIPNVANLAVIYATDCC
eukprot:m.1430711 g.1430711  ORF g.1430711 m.1430711 type:complete len:119 (+) comp25074_c0_seq15:297-653(+)